VRPAIIAMIITGLVLGLTAVVLGVWRFLDHNGKFPWFYWIAPLLLIGFFAVMLQLTIMYWMKVGRLETRGRPRK